jgi:hypothetical protein
MAEETGFQRNFQEDVYKIRKNFAYFTEKMHPNDLVISELDGNGQDYSCRFALARAVAGHLNISFKCFK